MRKKALSDVRLFEGEAEWKKPPRKATLAVPLMWSDFWVEGALNQTCPGVCLVQTMGRGRVCVPTAGIPEWTQHLNNTAYS